MDYKSKNFLWGGSLSAVQVDGIGKHPRSKILHDYLYEKYPAKHWSGIGPNVCIDFTNRYQEDIDLYKEIGINSIRYGFMWSRLFPDGEKLNKEAVKYYHEVIDAFIKAGIDPMMQLFHFDTPMWVKEVGGWTQEIVTKRFAKFAKFIFSEYGKKINFFCTFNEPAVMRGTFLDKEWYADGKLSDERAWKECIGLFKANAAAFYEFEKAKKADLLKANTKLGVVINYNKTYPVSDKPSVEELEAVKNLDAFMNIFWTDGMVIGKINERVEKGLEKYGQKFPITIEERKYISKVKMDFIGENYYLPWRAEARSKAELAQKGQSPEFYLYKPSKKEGARENKFRGWEIFPEGLTGTLVDLWEMYKVPVYVGENGMGVDNEERFRNENGFIDDEYRISFVKEHIEAMIDAIEKGVDVFGYHVWSMTDLWSSYNAFKNRYGFIEVNLNNNLQRKMKKSAIWYKDFIKNRVIKPGYVKCDVITAKAMEESEQIMKKASLGKQNYEKIFKS